MSELTRAMKLTNRRRTGLVLSVAGGQCYIDIGGLPVLARLGAGVLPNVGDTVAVTDVNGELVVEIVTESTGAQRVERVRPVSSGEQDGKASKRLFVETIAVSANGTYTLTHNLGICPTRVDVWHIDGSGDYVKVLNEASLLVNQQTIKIVTGSYTVDNNIRQSTGGSYFVVAE